MVQYVKPSICACCGCEDRHRKGSFIPEKDWPNFLYLKVTDAFILKHTPKTRFTYICHQLDGLLLDPKGIRAVDKDFGKFEMYLCQDCKGYLYRNVMPRLALNNHLYRGELPDELKNVTWVEEMACSLYKTTAHVTRIYGSNKSSDPLQMHGNACAHPLDICSAVKILPWTPTDLNDLISIIFVGPRKLTEKDLQKLKPFFVRREVIRRLLNMLCHHNQLYIGLPPPDAENLALFPEYGLLPGLEERIVY
ncbi:hypothetical protein F5877DRAFT_53974, partial [Lentinula edodes]